MRNFDICVIGAGPAGYAAAIRALDFGKRVLLIEKDKIGGAGVHNGALTSKTMWELSRKAESLRICKQEEDALSIYSYQEISNEVNLAATERRTHLENNLKAYQDFLGNDLLTIFKGTARFENNTHLILTDLDGKEEKVFADYSVLATGSRPRYLPNLPIDENIVVTSDGIHSWTEYPKSLVILGAGVIGCEFASIFSSFGYTNVHLISKDKRILPFEDQDLTDEIEKNFLKNGLTMHYEAELKEMNIVDGRVHYQLCFRNDYCEWFDVDKALISIGRIPNLEGLGLLELGLKLNLRGYIDDVDTQTSIPNIYAVGDLTADIALVNVAELEGRHAVEKIFGFKQTNLNYNNISTIMFLSPETASVGLNEKQCIEKGFDFKVVNLSYNNIARATAMRNTNGFFKLIVTDDTEMKILGMRALGEHASSAIQGVALLMSMNKGVDELCELIHPHPSIIEGVQECARVLSGKPIFRSYLNSKSVVYKAFRDGNYIDL